MFSKSIVNSARFLRMPPTSRLLYYDLGMAADDDGAVEAYVVMKMTGATEDDLKVLVSRGFVTVLNDDLVTYIQDWEVNNFIRKDRYAPSIYADLLKKSIKSGEKTDNTERLTDGIPTVDQTAPQVNVNKVKEVSLNRLVCREDGDQPTTYPPTLEEVKEYISERGNKIDPEKFYDVYQGRGWQTKDGELISDWRAMVRMWERTQYDDIKPKYSSSMSSAPAPPSSFDVNEMYAAALKRTYGDDYLEIKDD